MPKHPHRTPTERAPEIAAGLEFRTRVRLALAGAAALAIGAPGETQSEETPLEGAERALPRRSRSHLGAALAGVIAGAGLAAATESEAHADAARGNTTIGEVYHTPRAEAYQHHERIPEWTLPELNRAADCYSLLSSHYINPSFWWYVQTQGTEEPVYKALKLAIQNPDLLYYRENPDGSFSLLPRFQNPHGTLPPDFEIVIQGGTKSGYPSQVNIDGKNIRLNHDAYLNWKQYQRVMASILGPEAEFYLWLQNLNSGIPPDNPAMEQMRHDLPQATVDNLRNKRQYERMLPHLIAQLWELRRGSHLGVLDPATDNPGTVFGSIPNPMQEFLDRLPSQPSTLQGDATLDSVANPDENPDVIEIQEPIGNDLNPFTRTILALTTDGRIVEQDLTITDKVRYKMPDERTVKSTRQIIFERLRRSLGL